MGNNENEKKSNAKSAGAALVAIALLTYFARGGLPNMGESIMKDINFPVSWSQFFIVSAAALAVSGYIYFKGDKK